MNRKEGGKEMALPARQSRYTPNRWDPFAALEDLHDEMSRLLTNVFPDVGRISVNAWSPPVDVEEDDDAYVVEADIPGVRADDVSVEVTGNELRITGRIEEGVSRRRTRQIGEFDYRLTLPGGVDAEGAEANLEHGVIKLRLPKTARATRHRIPVVSTTTAEVGPSEPSEPGEQGEQASDPGEPSSEQGYQSSEQG
jgi:HSP20 family protein